jgi:taurine dioxygenase
VRASEAIKVVPITGVIGAEIRGVDLRQPLDERQRVAIHDALVQHLVVFFRDQPLTEEEQVAFATSFGQPHTTTPDPAEQGSVLARFEDT